MTRDNPDYDVNLVELAARIRETLRRKGWSDARFEREAGLAGGSLTRLGKGERKRISQQSLRRISNVLGESYLYTVFGIKVGPMLQEIPGYSDAELEIARAEPWIPMEVIRAARTARMDATPAAITAEFLRDYLKLLAQHSFGIDTKAASAPSEQGRAPNAEESGERVRRSPLLGQKVGAAVEERARPPRDGRSAKRRK